MPHIELPGGLPGILGPMAFSPATSKPLNELAEVLLRGPNTLTSAERELIATYVSSQNRCRLRRPKPFTHALVAPWRDDAPAAGGPLFVFYAPRFLPATLIPVRLGGEQHSGTFFEGGKWQRLTTRPYGIVPPAAQP